MIFDEIVVVPKPKLTRRKIFVVVALLVNFAFLLLATVYVSHTLYVRETNDIVKQTKSFTRELVGRNLNYTPNITYTNVSWISIEANMTIEITNTSVKALYLEVVSLPVSIILRNTNLQNISIAIFANGTSNISEYPVRTLGIKLVGASCEKIRVLVIGNSVGRILSINIFMLNSTVNELIFEDSLNISSFSLVALDSHICLKIDDRQSIFYSFIYLLNSSVSDMTLTQTYAVWLNSIESSVVRVSVRSDWSHELLFANSTLEDTNIEVEEGSRFLVSYSRLYSSRLIMHRSATVYLVSNILVHSEIYPAMSQILLHSAVIIAIIIGIHTLITYLAISKEEIPEFLSSHINERYVFLFIIFILPGLIGTLSIVVLDYVLPIQVVWDPLAIPVFSLPFCLLLSVVVFSYLEDFNIKDLEPIHIDVASFVSIIYLALLMSLSTPSGLSGTIVFCQVILGILVYSGSINTYIICCHLDLYNYDDSLDIADSKDSKSGSTIDLSAFIIPRIWKIYKMTQNMRDDLIKKIRPKIKIIEQILMIEMGPAIFTLDVIIINAGLNIAPLQITYMATLLGIFFTIIGILVLRIFIKSRFNRIPRKAILRSCSYIALLVVTGLLLSFIEMTNGWIYLTILSLQWFFVLAVNNILSVQILED